MELETLYRKIEEELKKANEEIDRLRELARTRQIYHKAITITENLGKMKEIPFTGLAYIYPYPDIKIEDISRYVQDIKKDFAILYYVKNNVLEIYYKGERVFQSNKLNIFGYKPGTWEEIFNKIYVVAREKKLKKEICENYKKIKQLKQSWGVTVDPQVYEEAKKLCEKE